MTPPGELAGRSVLITGASRGIGRAIALACGAAGADVGVGFHRSEAQAREVVAAIELHGGRACAVPLDVADAASVAAGFEAFAGASGAVRGAGATRGLDALVACAGVASSGLLATASVEDLERLVRTNALGPLLCAREALPRMLARRGGVIVFLGSVATARPSRGQAAYAASKAGVEALTRSIAVEYGRKGIRAACVRPGAIETDMLKGTLALARDEVLARIPARRLGAPAEIAEVVTFLLGDRAGYVNGAVIDVDGGYAAG